MPEQIRTFIAIELDDPQKNALAELQSRLKREPGSNAIRWVTPDNIHLTLKFLGNVAAEKQPTLHDAIASACAGSAPFVLRLDGVGAFPNAHRPNVIWVGMEGDVETATKLAKKIDDACTLLGFPSEERPFSPHLTLGRVKRDASARDRQAIGEMLAQAQAHDLGECHVEGVCVMKSELRPVGSVYTRLAIIRLS
jgi:RNA 2',3'-cyclic 3'-phosphodiesterase